MVFHLLVWAGARPDGMLRWLALVLTYSVHAAAWAAVAAISSRWCDAAPSSKNLYFKLALFGPLLTTLATATLPARADGAQVMPADRGVSVTAFTNVRVGPPLVKPSADSRPLATLLLGVDGARPAWGRRTRFVAFVAAGAAALGLLRFVLLFSLLRRQLCARRAVRDARVLERLEHVCARSKLGRVALSEHSELTSPLVLGRSEICIPLALARELSDAELDTVLAHELAHLERGDGLWFPAVGLVEAVSWFYPFNHWMARRFRESAELACDDRAVALTGDPHGLARALVQVAQLMPRTRRLALLPTIVRSASALVPRVERLTGNRKRLVRGASSRRRRWAFGTFALLGVVTATLKVQVVDARPVRVAATSTAASTSAADAVAGGAPDAAEGSARLAELVGRERELERELAVLLTLPEAAREGTPAAVRVLELRQALRHTRATELWLERTFVEHASSWDHRSAAAVR